MSIYGVGPSTVGQTPPQRTLRDGARAPAQQPVTTGPSAANPFARSAPANAASNPAQQQSIPVDPPAGTDPALWSVLSSDERAFFAKAGAMGPLTYGRAFEDQRASQLPASRGGRLDVKV